MKVQGKLLAAAAILILALSVQLRAQYVLTEVAEVYIPGASSCTTTIGSYDLQHWTSDSTYGWVHSVNQNTFSYCLDIASDEIHSLTTDMDLHGARIIGGNPEEPRIVAFYHWDSSVDNYCMVFHYVKVLTGEIGQANNALCTACSYQCGFNSLSVDVHSVWPPPPFGNSFLIATLSSHVHCDYMADRVSDTFSGFGSIFQIDEEMSRSVLESARISPFSRYDTLEFATTDYYYQYGGDWGQPPSYMHSWENIGLYSVLEDSIYLMTTCESDSSNCSNARVIAQIDLDGTKRVLLRGQCYLIDENNEFNELWLNSDLNSNSAYSATFTVGDDERFIQNRGNYFDVYDAATGEFIGSTTHFEGEFQYLIKLPDRVTEFVTLDDDNDIVRVYKPGDAILLTLHVLPASNSLQLNWYPVTGASSYTVWLRHPPPMTGPYFAGTTTDTTLTIPIPEESVGYFNVETNY